jgi:hypothetical protein
MSQKNSFICHSHVLVKYISKLTKSSTAKEIAEISVIENIPPFF